MVEDLRTENMRIGGTTIQYYFTCRRELWLYLNHIDPEHDDENLTVGRIIHERSHKRRGTKEIEIAGSKLDLMKNGKKPMLLEIKKSSKLLEPTIKQLQFYLYILEKQGIHVPAEISIPKEKKRIPVELDDKSRELIEDALREIPVIATSDTIPEYVRKPYCKNCAYRTFCEV